MDEPLSNLDAKLRVQMRADIAALQRELDVTTIYVTHDQVEAMTMGDRVAVMRKGLLQQVDDPQVLYDEPDNLFVAGFIGSPPMNMAEARIVEHGDGARRRDRRPGSDARSQGRGRSAGHPWLHRQDRRDRHPLRGPQRAGSAQRRAGGPADALQRRCSPRRWARRSSSTSPSRRRRCRPRTPRSWREDAHSDDKIGTADRGRGTKFVASFSPRSRVRPGDPIEVGVDTSRLYFFDLETGLAIRS